nr:DNA-protecting protein DprA [Propionibacterium sp.]
MHEERDTRRALACVVEGGDPRLAALIARHGVAEVWRLVLAGATDPAWTARARALDLGSLLRAERRCSARFLIPGDPEWPERLGDLEFCPEVQRLGGVPAGLWVRGERPLADAVEASVSIVGSRASSSYGDRVATELADGLVAEGVSVVSGGAFGIDAAAHRGALAGGGPTVAFVAGGVDEPYPRTHAQLLERVVEHGAVVSEYPPGERPTRYRFLARNRLIAAISQGTVIVEAAVRSGARNTVTWASGCGRPVMAVPGPIGNVTSFTPHRLIREGEAVLVTGVADVRELIGPLGVVGDDRPRCARLFDTLDADQRAVLEALPERGGRDAGEVALRAGVTVAAAFAALSELAEAGLVTRRGDGLWRLGEFGNRPLVPVPGPASER